MKKFFYLLISDVYYNIFYGTIQYMYSLILLKMQYDVSVLLIVIISSL
jgi:hypothetical protein